MKIRKAAAGDLARIVEIYNQAIPTRAITADLTPVTVASRSAWFDFHLTSPSYPIWVMETQPEKTAVKNPAVFLSPEIFGWFSFSPFYPREAFAQTVEISLYLDQQRKGQGWGSQALQFMQQEMHHYDIHTLMAYVMEENHISRRAFEKQGFSQWGRYPNIANMGDRLQTFLIYGFQQL
ncbi:MAG: GNAT family N-acetyltransferase [Pasteurellaceae bacterium]|nr:GNAT family N-acetyltransferase [Pasteurellaceae bacterium]